MLKKVTLNKKGSLFDYLEIIPIIFVGLVVIVVTIFAFKSINDAGAFAGSTDSQTVANSFINSAIPMFDIVVMAGFVGLFIGSIILAFSLPTNPSFFWINILLLTVLMFLAVGLSNAYESIENVGALSSATSELTITSFVMDKLPIFTVIYGIVLVVVMLGVKRLDGQEDFGGGL